MPVAWCRCEDRHQPLRAGIGGTSCGGTIVLSRDKVPYDTTAEIEEAASHDEQKGEFQIPFTIGKAAIP